MNEILAIDPAYASLTALAAISKSSDIGGMYLNGDVAVVNIRGAIFHHNDFFTSFFGIPTTENLSRIMNSLVENSDVSAIVMAMDTPGGGVYGLKEFADQVNEQGKIKPIIAVGEGAVSSAGFWIASAATAFHSIESGTVGSVGVVAMHVDFSEKMKKEGVAIEYISAGKFKTEGNSAGPLTQEARAYKQEMIDEYYDSFVSSVARYKGISKDKVISDFGEGRTLIAQKALKYGMIDGVATVGQAVQSLRSGKKRKSKSYNMAMIRIEELV